MHNMFFKLNFLVQNIGQNNSWVYKKIWTKINFGFKNMTNPSWTNVISDLLIQPQIPNFEVDVKRHFHVEPNLDYLRRSCS